MERPVFRPGRAGNALKGTTERLSYDAVSTSDSITMRSAVVRSAKYFDNRVWRILFGPADYMQLRPPAGLRLKVAFRLPFAAGRATCADPIFIVGCPRSATSS